MRYYDRIDVSQQIDINKASASKDCNICHYCYLLHMGVKFQPDVGNTCHNVLMMCMELSEIVILNIHSADYHCIIDGFSKSEAINLMQKHQFDQKSRTL